MLFRVQYCFDFNRTTQLCYAGIAQETADSDIVSVTTSEPTHPTSVSTASTGTTSGRTKSMTQYRFEKLTDVHFIRLHYLNMTELVLIIQK
jgi:hypothetical protein